MLPSPYAIGNHRIGPVQEPTREECLEALEKWREAYGELDSRAEKPSAA